MSVTFVTFGIIPKYIDFFFFFKSWIVDYRRTIGNERESLDFCDDCTMSRAIILFNSDLKCVFEILVECRG